MRSAGIVYLILYENILVDGDMHCNGTGGTYLDMGTNVGYQVNKLYRPECTSPVQNIFDEFFKKRRSVCTIGIEPNPLLQTKLSNLRKTGRFGWTRSFQYPYRGGYDDLATTVHGIGLRFSHQKGPCTGNWN